MSKETFSRAFLLILVASISLLFVLMVRSFLMTLLLAAIFSGISQPLYKRFVRFFRGRRAIASLSLLFFLVLVIVGPVFAFLGILVAQAIEVSQTVGPWIQAQIEQPDKLARLTEKIPAFEKLKPYRVQILTRLGEAVGALGNFFVSTLSNVTKGTITFLFHLVILIYAMFFFLVDGKRILDRILYYVPLSDEDERDMVDKFVSVTRATLKGTLIIGIIQGGLGAVGFAVAGIHGAVFWGTIMTFLSIIPGVGPAVVWIPAVVYLFLAGHTLSALLLALYCGLIVSTADNFLRPRLVGRDVKMHDLLILLGTLGGIMLFGVAGFIIGPILAALFKTVWEIYGTAFRDVLPHQGPESASKD